MLALVVPLDKIVVIIVPLRSFSKNSSNNRYEIRSAIEKKASGLSDAIRIRLGNQSEEEDD